MLIGESYPERKKDNGFSSSPAKTLLPVGSRSKFVSVREQKHGFGYWRQGYTHTFFGVQVDSTVIFVLFVVEFHMGLPPLA
jgi:hypothetical protein